jgi:hypothetical protein
MSLRDLVERNAAKLSKRRVEYYRAPQGQIDRPTQAQIWWVRELAKRKGVEVPGRALIDRDACTVYIKRLTEEEDGER